MRDGKPALRREKIRISEVVRRVMRGPLVNRYGGLSILLAAFLCSHKLEELKKRTPSGIYCPFTKAPGETLGGVSAKGG